MQSLCQPQYLLSTQLLRVKATANLHTARDVIKFRWRLSTGRLCAGNAEAISQRIVVATSTWPLGDPEKGCFVSTTVLTSGKGSGQHYSKSNTGSL
jgi:hypothetical protein